MALTPPENSVSAAAGDEAGPDLNSQARRPPSASTTGPDEATSCPDSGGALAREDSDAKGDLVVRTEAVVGAEVEVIDDVVAVSERGKDAGSSGEASGCGDADKMFVEMGEPPAEAKSTDEPVEGAAQMVGTGEVKVVEEIGELTEEISIVVGKAVVVEKDAEITIDMDAGIVDVSGVKKDIVYSRRRLQVEYAQPAQVREEEPTMKKRVRSLNSKSTMNGTANADELPSEDKHSPGKSSIKKKQRRSQKLAVDSVEHVDCRLRAEGAQVREELTVKKRGRPSKSKSTMNGTANADELPSEDKRRPGKSSIKKKQERSRKSAVESVEHVDCLLDENVQMEEHVPGLKRKRGTMQRHALEGTEHVKILYDENVQNGQRSSSVQNVKDADGSTEENVQAGERASSTKKKRRPGRVLMEGSEHVKLFYPFQDEMKRKFAVNDLVWAKVRSHPWWPGQIFDASDASKLALNVHKKGQLLVAYFGDKTFAWCDKSQLKPFQKCFAQLVKNCSIDTFVTAVDEALEEASRRVELGMTCSCLSDDTHTRLKEQKFENTGIRECTFSGMVDKSWIMNSFQPVKLMDYVLELALAPKGGTDRLDCSIANAQLRAFHRSKGYPERPIFFPGGRGLENDDQDSVTNKEKSDKCVPDPRALVSPDYISGTKMPTGRSSSSMSQKNVEDKNILFDLIEENADVIRLGTGTGASLHSSGRKRKTLANRSASKIKRSEPLGDMGTKSATNLPKIGERICRIAGLLTGSPPMLKYNAEKTKECTSKASLKKCSSAHEPNPKEERHNSMDKDTSHLCLDMKLVEIIDGKRGKRKLAKLKLQPDSAASNCTQDSYQSGTIIDDNPEEKLVSNSPKRKES